MKPVTNFYKVYCLLRNLSLSSKPEIPSPHILVHLHQKTEGSNVSLPMIRIQIETTDI